MTPAVVADAGGRLRLSAPALTGSPARAVLAEEALDEVPGVLAVHAFPVTGHVVVWLTTEVSRTALLDAVAAVAATPAGAEVPGQGRHEDDGGAAVVHVPTLDVNDNRSR